MTRKPYLLSPPKNLTRKDVVIDDDLVYLVRIGKPATGTLTICNEDGVMDFRFELYNGRKHGLCESFFPDGNLQYWCRFRHGKQDLYDERFDKHGSLIQSNCWRDGHLHGRCKSYELGRLSAVQDFKDGKLHGLWETYGPRNVTFFSGQYVEGKPDGTHVWRFIDNKVEAECLFDLGVKTGLWRDFYNTGQLKRQRTYEDDELVGEDRSYFESGVLASVMTYKHGTLNGPCMEFHPNGNLKRSFPYAKGVPAEFERHYDQSLRMLREVAWQDGKALSDLNYMLDQ